MIGGDQDERCIRGAAQARGKGSLLFAAQQVPSDSRRLAVEAGLAHPPNEPSRQHGVKLAVPPKEVFAAVA